MLYLLSYGDLESWLIHASAPSDRRFDAERISKGGKEYTTPTTTMHIHTLTYELYIVYCIAASLLFLPRRIYSQPLSSFFSEFQNIIIIFVFSKLYS